MKIKAVVFDMDGVLVDALDIHRSCFDQACAEYGVDLTPQKLRSLDSLPTRVKLAKLGVPSQQVVAISARKQVLTHMAAKQYPEDQSRIEIMDWLVEAGYAIGVYTNSIRSTTNVFLASAGVWGHIDAIVTNEDVTKPKPDPEGYRSCMEILDVEPMETMILEDSDLGFHAAVESGAHCLQVEFRDVTLKNIQHWLKRLEEIV